jgi:hypothetical protein
MVDRPVLVVLKGATGLGRAAQQWAQEHNAAPPHKRSEWPVAAPPILEPVRSFGMLWTNQVSARWWAILATIGVFGLLVIGG